MTTLKLGLKEVSSLRNLWRYSYVLALVGALNWGLIGLMDLNLVHELLGGMDALERLVYVLVGLAGLGLLLTHPRLTGGSASRKGKRK